jgi:hypothetical protein
MSYDKDTSPESFDHLSLRPFLTLMENERNKEIDRDCIRQYNRLSRLKKDMVNRKIRKMERRKKRDKK